MLQMRKLRRREACALLIMAQIIKAEHGARTQAFFPLGHNVTGSAVANTLPPFSPAPPGLPSFFSLVN